MEEYKNRYPRNRQKQDAYENACDCLENGLNIRDWKQCGLDKKTALLVWSVACMDAMDAGMI